MQILELAVCGRSDAVLLPEGAGRCPAMRWKVEVAKFRSRGRLASYLPIAVKFSSTARGDVTVFFQRAIFQFGSVMINSIEIP